MSAPPREVIIGLAPSEPKGLRETFFDRPDGSTIQQHWTEPRYLDVTVRDGAGAVLAEYSVLTGVPAAVTELPASIQPLGFQDGNSYMTDLYADYQDGAWIYDSDCEHEYKARYLVDFTSTDYTVVTTDNDVICPGYTEFTLGFGWFLIDSFPDDPDLKDRVCLRVTEIDAAFNDDKGQQC